MGTEESRAAVTHGHDVTAGAPSIRRISLPLPYHLGSVNCYLLRTVTGFVLIDTGCSSNRAALERELASAGCAPGYLKLIILTHGDFDHTGNVAYLRDKFGAKVAMHQSDAGMAERGDMFWNRKKGNALFRVISPMMFKFAEADRFTPDFYVGEGDDLSPYGLDARVISLPGHSSGSIGVVLRGPEQAIFCGDELTNRGKPALGDIIDDKAAALASLERLRSLGSGTVYPGHGEPFQLEKLGTVGR